MKIIKNLEGTTPQEGKLIFDFFKKKNAVSEVKMNTNVINLFLGFPSLVITTMVIIVSPIIDCMINKELES